MTLPSGQTAPAAGDLARRSVSALKWSYLGVAVRTVLQLGIGILLARLLGPGPFGIVAVAWLVIGICNLFAEFGFSSALVQSEHLLDQDVRFVFTCQFLLGVALSAAGIAAAPWLSAYFREPRAELPMQAMFLLFAIQAIGQTSTALLRRTLNFKVIQRVSIGSYVIGYVLIGVPLALSGFGIWALVAAYLSQALLSTIGLMHGARPPLGLAFRPASAHLVGFGGRVIGANVASYAISNLDSLMIGRMLGVTQLGLYNRAMQLVSSPMSAFVSGLQGVLFSACSRVQNDKMQIRRAFFGATVSVALVCMPLFFGIAAAAHTVILVLYGAQWSAASAALRPLAFAMPLTALLAVCGPVLMALNRTIEEIKAQVVAVIVMVPLLYVAASRSLAWVAWSMLLVYAIRWALLARAVLRVVDARWSDLFLELAWPTLLSFVATAGVWGADEAGDMAGLPPAARLGLCIVAGGVLLLAGLRLAGTRLLSGAFGDFARARGPLPRPVSILFNVAA